MSASCTVCSTQFEITSEDREFLDRFQVPDPTQCPSCRLQRRLCERNTRNLYYRKCDLTGKQIISQHHSSSPFPVYGIEAWNGDGWNGLSYGRDIDFSRPFFEQFAQLKNVVPHLALFNTPGTLENSDYNNCTAYIKNCYLICESDFDEDCYYSNLLKKSKNLVDCSVCYESELCYECVDCIGCQRLLWSRNCQNCHDSFSLEDCVGCSECIGCVNQRQKRYMIYDKQYSKEEFEKHRAAFRLDTAAGVATLRNACRAYFLTQPHKHRQGEHNENCDGEYINNSKNAHACFDVKDTEDCRHCARLSLQCKSCMDYNSWGDNAELVYQSSACGDHVYNVKCCSTCIAVTNADYSFECTHCTDIFGCVGLRREKYCILNKQYAKEEYEQLKAKLIAHMKKTGEYGEYFPMNLCSFAYNETLAMDQFPLTKEETKAKDWRWFEAPEKGEVYKGKKTVVPEAIADVTDDVCTKILQCEATGRPYKIIPQELKFYRQLSIPLPRKCPDARHAERVALRNPYRLWDRTCAKCGQPIRTSYQPSRPEIVYCEACYLASVY